MTTNNSRRLLPFAINVTIVGVLLLFKTGASGAEDTKKEQPAESNEQTQNLVSIVKKAIISGDYTALRADSKKRNTISWHTPNESYGVNQDLTFEEIEERLLAASKNARVIVNKEATWFADEVTIETSGWTGGNQHLYWEFQLLGDNNDVWRWTGIYQSPSRFEAEAPYKIAEWPAAGKALPSLLSSLEEACAKRNFSLLKQYLPENIYYTWCACGPHDMGCNEYSFEKTSRLLKSYSKNAKMDINPEPDVYVGVNGDKSLSVETDGWTSEYPFIYLIFSKSYTDKRWMWRGVCDDVGPSWETKRNAGKHERVYYKKPRLPRSGPRIFHDSNSLKARIEEIIQFREFDALTAYAVRNKLIFGHCSWQEIESDRAIGKEVPAQTVVAFLKEKAEGASNIRRSKVSYKKTYETTGWNGEYPYITFWISESDKGWELSGASYCKSNRIEVIQNQGDNSFGLFRWLREQFQ